MKLIEALPDVVGDVAGALIRIGRGDVADQLREVMLQRWTYDETVDAGYVYVTSPRHLNVVDQNVIGVKHGETLSFYDELGINVDLDNHQRVTGLEILDAKHVADLLSRIAG